MMQSLVMRLLLAIILVVNGVGGALADVRGITDPVADRAGDPHRAHHPPGAPEARPPAVAAAMPGCHEQGAGPAGMPAAAPVPDAPAHGHCCQDACHCVCTLQAHAPALLPAAVPQRTVAGLAALPGWVAPDPSLLLRPPIA